MIPFKGNMTFFLKMSYLKCLAINIIIIIQCNGIPFNTGDEKMRNLDSEGSFFYRYLITCKRS